MLPGATIAHGEEGGHLFGGAQVEVTADGNDREIRKWTSFNYEKFLINPLIHPGPVRVPAPGDRQLRGPAQVVGGEPGGVRLRIYCRITRIVLIFF